MARCFFAQHRFIVQVSQKDYVWHCDPQDLLGHNGDIVTAQMFASAEDFISIGCSNLQS